MRIFPASLAILATLLPTVAAAWTRQGHMVTAEIAYEQLLATAPGVIDEAAALLEDHPDRGAFEVAAGRATGRERARRLLIECARWPDDARKTAYDHPYWHAWARPVIDAAAPPPVVPPADVAAFDADMAFALNFRTLRDPTASRPERAVALCWVLHLAGDVHQPLHTAQLFSARFPTGDRLGLDQYVKDPATGRTVSLHWYWDDSVNQSNEDAEVVRRAAELTRRYPRGSLTELRSPGKAQDFDRWARDESYTLAVRYAYGQGQAYGTSSKDAPPMTGEHVRAIRTVAERRVAIAGYRMADLLREAFGQ